MTAETPRITTPLGVAIDVDFYAQCSASTAIIVSDEMRLNTFRYARCQRTFYVHVMDPSLYHVVTDPRNGDPYAFEPKPGERRNWEQAQAALVRGLQS